MIWQKDKLGRRFFDTPWGPSQSIREVAQGIYLVDTAGHGGYYCEPHIVETLPEYIRETPYNPRGFFEEDAGWSLLALCRPDLFSGPQIVQAYRTARRSYPAQFEQLKNDGKI